MKAFRKTRSNLSLWLFRGPKAEIFTTKDPFFRILAFALLAGFVFLVLRFLLTPTFLVFIAIPLYFFGLALLNELLTPMIQEPQAILYALQSFL